MKSRWSWSCYESLNMTTMESHRVKRSQRQREAKAAVHVKQFAESERASELAVVYPHSSKVRNDVQCGCPSLARGARRYLFDLDDRSCKNRRFEPSAEMRAETCTRHLTSPRCIQQSAYSRRRDVTLTLPRVGQLQTPGNERLASNSACWIERLKVRTPSSPIVCAKFRQTKRVKVQQLRVSKAVPRSDSVCVRANTVGRL